MTASEIHFFSPSLSKEKEQQQQQSKQRNPSSDKPQIDKQTKFKLLYECSPDSVVFTILLGFAVTRDTVTMETEPNPPSPLSDLYKPHYSSLSNTALSQLVSELFSKIEVNQLEADFLKVFNKKTVTIKRMA